MGMLMIKAEELEKAKEVLKKGGVEFGVHTYHPDDASVVVLKVADAGKAKRMLEEAGVSEAEPGRLLREPGFVEPKRKLGFLFNLDRCIGCRSCEIACKMEKELPAGSIRPMRVIELGPEKAGERLRYDFVPMNCFHCGSAPCAEACPTGAMQKRQDGIVFVDAEACIGCKQCIKACPFGAPQYDSATGKVVKCDLCMHRVDAGLEPACVAKCPTRAILAGGIAELRRRALQRGLNLLQPVHAEEVEACVSYATRFELVRQV